MKVKDLIKELSKFDGELTIVMSSDSEGNNYSPLDDISIGYYMKESPYSGEMYYFNELTEELRKEGYSEDDLAPINAEKVVIFHPIN